MLFDLLPTATLLQLIFYPWFELKYELDALLIQNRHTTRSAFRGSSIIISGVVGIWLAWQWLGLYKFLLGFVEAFQIPLLYQPMATIIFSLIVFSGVGAYVSKVIVRSFCKFRFGDPDYYLTDKRATELEQIFLNQGHRVLKEEIKETIAFAIWNFRKRPASSQIGVRPEDWANVIESIIYYEDYDRFLDQQEMLLIRRAKLREKQEVVSLYATTQIANLNSGGVANNQEPSSDNNNTNVRRSHDSNCDSADPSSAVEQELSVIQQRSVNPQFITPQFIAKQTITTVTSNENTPLLANQVDRMMRSPRSLTPNSLTDNEKMLAIQVLNKFTHCQRKRKKYTVVSCEQHLIEDCMRYLSSKELKTTNRIYPANRDVNLELPAAALLSPSRSLLSPPLPRSLLSPSRFLLSPPLSRRVFNNTPISGATQSDANGNVRINNPLPT